MYQNINEQFGAAARQFADTATQVNRLALTSAEKAFGVQLSTLEEHTNAAFACWGERPAARALDGLKAVLPKGLQVARENIERSVGAGQDVLAQAVSTNEAIARIARGQVEAAAAKAGEAVDTATRATGAKARK